MLLHGQLEGGDVLLTPCKEKGRGRDAILWWRENVREAIPGRGVCHTGPHSGFAKYI